MDTMTTTQQMIAFQKQSFANFQDFWDLAQTQTSSTVDRFMDQALWIPTEGRKALGDWRAIMKQERKRFAAYVDRQFTIYEKMVAAPQAATPAKTKKTSDPK